MFLFNYEIKKNKFFITIFFVFLLQKFKKKLIRK